MKCKHEILNQLTYKDNYLLIKLAIIITNNLFNIKIND